MCWTAHGSTDNMRRWMCHQTISWTSLLFKVIKERRAWESISGWFFSWQDEKVEIFWQKMRIFPWRNLNISWENIFIFSFFRPYERGSWAEISHSGNIVSVNAFYSPNSNTMIVPIGMLQDPLYWSQPKSLTFGAFGIVVGENYDKIYQNLDRSKLVLWSIPGRFKE